MTGIGRSRAVFRIGACRTGKEKPEKQIPLSRPCLSPAGEQRTMRSRVVTRMFRLSIRATFALCLLLVSSSSLVRAAQHDANKPDNGVKQQDKPNQGGGEGPGDKGKEDQAFFLVARQELRDPVFKESVVLMLPFSLTAGKSGEGPVIGLIVNRSARVALSDVFPGDKTMKDRSETAYFGGPVDTRSPGVVFRASKGAKQAALLFGDVYVSFDPEFIKGLLKKPEKTPDLRLFLGRSQWSAPQLQNEMLLGAWLSVPAEKNLIFSTSPQYLWHNLSEQLEPGPIAKALDQGFFAAFR